MTNHLESAQYPLNVDYTRPAWFDQHPIPAKGFVLEKFDAGELYIPKGTTYGLESNPGKQLENPFDLRNLRFINPEEVLSSIEILEKSALEGKFLVCTIATGGTIASELSKEEEGKEEAKTALKQEVAIEELLGYTGRRLLENYTFSVVQLPKLIDSSRMKLDFDADIAIAISYTWKKLSNRAKSQLRGFLVAHGTDTMSSSSTKVSMMLGSNIDFSVGFVGSISTIDEEGNEIPDNLYRGINTLGRLFREGKPATFIFMGGSEGSAMHPASTIKVSDTDIKAFRSELIPPLIQYGNSLQQKKPVNVPFFEAYSQKGQRSEDDVFAPIIVRGYSMTRTIQAAMDLPPDEWNKIVDAFDPSVRAIILQTYGSFTFDLAQFDKILEAAKRRNLLVYAGNPFPTGRTDHLYAEALYITNHGAVPIHMLPHAADVKLKILDAVFGPNIEAIKSYMINNSLIGEQPLDWTPVDPSSGARSYGQPKESLPKIELPVYP